MTAIATPTLFSEQPHVEVVMDLVREILQAQARPSAWELLQQVDHKLEPKARWAVTDALCRLADDASLPAAARDYLRDLLKSGDVEQALKGKTRPGEAVESSIDALLRQSAAYRSSAAFQEMVTFMATFRDYAPFNNMLVRIQNPSCSFFATKRDWERRFKRHLKEDPRPMLILAPMHPVMLVYDLDQTDGQALPSELQEFARFAGEWDERRLTRTVENAMERDRIRIDFKPLSSTNAGFATIAWGQGNAKMRIAIHDALDAASQYGAVCHELAHIYLGHLGGDSDGWWPSRGELAPRAMEIEAEAVAYVVTQRAGLSGPSHRYVSRYLNDDALLKSVSTDLIAKVAGRLEEMATRKLKKRRIRGEAGETQ